MEKNTYELSVIIPTYNRSKLLRYTLESLLGQNVDKDCFEVIVGDDGSSDDTKELVSLYEKSMNVKYVFQEDKGYRPASVRNKAIRLASGRICLLIDSSVILATDCIAQHIAFHQRNVSSVAIGYVFGFDHNEESEDQLIELVVPADPTGSIARLSQYEVFHDVRNCHYLRYQDKIEVLPAPWYYFWTCHLSALTSDLNSVGLFDEHFDGRWGGEDNDLGFRLHQNGVKMCILRSAQSIHYPHGKDKLGKQIEGYQNCLYFHSKFQTRETQVFIDHYLQVGDELADINQLLLSTAAKTLSV